MKCKFRTLINRRGSHCVPTKQINNLKDDKLTPLHGDTVNSSHEEMGSILHIFNPFILSKHNFTKLFEYLR